MKDTAKGFWRLFQPLRIFFFKYPIQIFKAYANFFKSWQLFQQKGGSLNFRFISPVLHFDLEDTQTGGGHYFYQDIWALRKLAHIKPLMHYDIGSRFDGFVGQATAICPITCIDIRPPAFKLSDFYFQQGDILKLPFADNTLQSLSCLHTIEHIGLGRYGDEINPEGFEQSLSEIQRVIKPGGNLILSMPIGVERIEFNAQRILNPLSCIKHLFDFDLLEFSIVNEKNEFLANVLPEAFQEAKYCCGLYLFKKKDSKA